MIQKLRNDKRARWLFTFCCVVLSVFLQAAIIQIFMDPINLLSSGFTEFPIVKDTTPQTHAYTTSRTSNFGGTPHEKTDFL